jgi:ABC-type glycerol-3-phosphate transport system substrate-binding protein
VLLLNQFSLIGGAVVGRRLVALAAGTALVVAAAGCSSGGGDDPDGPAELLMWTTGSDDDATTFQQAADLYTEQSPDVTITVQANSWDDSHARILSAASAGEGPDIITGGLSWGTEFGRLGGMIDLRDHGIDEITNNIPVDLMRSVISPGGEVYGIPIRTDLNALIYRTDLLAEIGYDQPPQDWDELVDVIARLHDELDINTPFLLAWKNPLWLQYFNYNRQAGGSFYSDDCSQVTIDDPAGVMALEFFRDLHESYWVPTGDVEIPPALASGEAAMGSDGSWQLGGIESGQPDLVGKWASAPLPAGPAGHGSFIGGQIAGIMSYSDNADTAADFLRFLYTEQATEAVVNQAYNLGILFVPARTDQLPLLPVEDHIMTTLQQSYELAAEGPPPCSGWEESQNDVHTQLEAVLLEGKDPATALRDAAEVMRTNLG